MSKRIQWKLEKRPVAELSPYHKNPRIITPEKLKELESSFDECGNFQPIVINTDNVILSGHARFMQMKNEGQAECEVMIPDRVLTPKQEEAIVIRANKTTAGVWDFDILANEFDVSDLLGFGFTASELNLDMPDIDSSSISEPTSKEKICPECGAILNN